MLDKMKELENVGENTEQQPQMFEVVIR